MRASIIGILLGAALAPAASAQTVIQRSITQQPVETTVTQTPSGTIVTRRPLGAAEEIVPNTIDAITTREVVRRAEATRRAPRTRELTPRQVLTTRQVSERHVSARPAARKAATVQKPVTTRRIALTPAQRHVIYQTIVEREVQPAPRIVAPAPYAVPAPYLAPQPPLVSAQVALPGAPVVTQDEVVETPAYAVGAVLPASVPLYAVPQDVALRIPAVQRYGYAYVGRRAYLVDPASGTVVEDVTE
jgi:hypothetical protein